MTPEGHRRMQDELRQLLRVERPKVVETVAWAAGNGDRSENGDYIYGKRRLRDIDRRIRFLSKRLDSAEVVDPNQQRSGIGVHGRSESGRGGVFESKKSSQLQLVPAERPTHQQRITTPTLTPIFQCCRTMGKPAI